MTFEESLRLGRVSARIKLWFDNYLNGGRRSLVWNDAQQKEYTSKLAKCGRISHRTETSLHAFLTSDLTIDAENTPSNPGGYGFWDQDHDTFDLKPFTNILCRITASVQAPDGTWSADSPIFTGVVDDVETSNVERMAQIQAIGIPTFLIEEDASDVKDGDAYYQSIRINDLIRKVLTQKDRWVRQNADNIACTVTASGQATNYVSVSRSSGLWYADESGMHPNNILAGYVVRITSGTAIGKEYVIASNILTLQSGMGYGGATCYTSGDPFTDGVIAGDTAIVTGWCWPFMDYEVDGFLIDSVSRIPTYDGKPALSTFGRPPEDGTLGICEALEHDDTYLWLGVDNKLYRYDFTNDRYTLMVTLSPSTLCWRRGYFRYGAAKMYFFAWADDPNSSVAVTAYIFEVPSGLASGQAWTSVNAMAVLDRLYPGDFLTRAGVGHWNPPWFGNPVLPIRTVGRYDWAGSNPNVYASQIVCPFAQSLRITDASGGVGVQWAYQRGAHPFATATDRNADSGSWFPYVPISDPWTYAAVHGWAASMSDPVPSFRVQSHVGGTIQTAIYLTPTDLSYRGLYYWRMDEGGAFHLYQVVL